MLKPSVDDAFSHPALAARYFSRIAKVMSPLSRLLLPVVALLALFAPVLPRQLACADEANFEITATSDVRSVALSGDGRSLAVLGYGPERSSSLVLWDLSKESSRSVNVEGTPNSVRCQLAFSADDKYLIYSDVDRFKVFDVTTLAVVVNGKGQRPLRLVDGVLLTADVDQSQGQMHLHGLNAAVKPKSFGLPRTVGNNATQVVAADISDDGSAIAFAVGNVVRVLDPRNDQSRPDLTASGPVLHVALSQDGQQLAVWSKVEGPEIALYNCSDVNSLPQLVARIDLKRVVDVRTKFDLPIGLRFVDKSGLCIASNTRIGIWDTEQNQFTDIDPVRGAVDFSIVDLSPEFITLNHISLKLDETRRRFVARLFRNDSDGDPWESPVRLTHSRNGDRIAYASSVRTVAVRQVNPPAETPQLLSTLRHLPNLLDSYVSSVFLFADDGAIAGLGANSTDEIQAFYETGSGKQLAATVGHVYDDGARVRPDTQLLFVRKLPLAFINSEKRQVLFLNAAAFSAPQGRTKALPIPSQWNFRPLDGGADAQASLKSPDPLLRNGGTASRVFRWKGDRYAFVAEITVPKPKLNPGKRVNQLTLVDAQTGEVIFNLADEIVAPNFDRRRAFGDRGILVSANGTRAVVPMDKGDLLLWDLETGNRMNCLLRYGQATGESFLDFGGSGQYLCSAAVSTNSQQQGRQQLELLDMNTGMVTPPIMVGPTKNHRIVAISPTEPRYLTHSVDGTLGWRDLLTGRLISSPDPHSSRLKNAAFSADGSVLGTISHENEVRFWKTPKSEVLEPIPSVKTLQAPSPR